MRKVLVLLIAALAVSVPLAALVPNQPAPGFTLKSLDGKTLSLADLKGKVVVVNFWATWCPPCREEIPDFVAFYNENRAKGLEIVGVSVDEKTAQQVKPFVDQNKMGYPVAMVTEKILRDYGPIQAIPTTFVIDKKGIVRYAQEGMLDKAALTAMFKKYSAEN